MKFLQRIFRRRRAAFGDMTRDDTPKTTYEDQESDRVREDLTERLRVVADQLQTEYDIYYKPERRRGNPRTSS